MSQTFTLKNYHLEGISKALNYPNQNFQVGRSKIRILKLLNEKSKVLETSRLEMLTALAAKDDKDKPIMKDVMVQRNPNMPPQAEQQYDISGENLIKFNKEFTEMMQEDCIVEIPDSLKNDFSMFKGLLANSQAKDLTDSDIVVIEEVLDIMNGKIAPKE